MLREYVGKLEMPFESGTFTTQGGKTVNFVRVVNVKEVIEQMVEELIESNSLKSPENINENTLYISLLGDKEAPQPNYFYKGQIPKIHWCTQIVQLK